MATSRVLQRLYSLDTASPDFLRNLYCLTQHDEKDQYLISLRGSELARLVNFLDEVLSAIPTTDGVARECLNKLHAICDHHAILPSLYTVSGEVSRVGDYPIDLGTIADVWEGTYRSEKVSIKYFGGRTKNQQALEWEDTYRSKTASIKCSAERTKNQQALEKLFFKEAVIWKRLRHPNIVPFIGVTTDPLQIVSEWMPNGTLAEFLERNPGANRIRLLLDVAEGLDYLHASNTTHGNLNGLSILVDRDGHARLTNFKFTSTVPGMNSARQRTGRTAALVAPEILQGADTITREADVFAFGMILIEVFTGRPPFSEFAAPIVISKIINCDRPPRPHTVGKSLYSHNTKKFIWQDARELGLTDSVWDMTTRCWHQDPSQRPTMTKVVGLLHESPVSSLSVEVDLSDFFQVCKTRGKGRQGEKAQEFTDMLDEVLDHANLDQRKRKQYLMHLQKLCNTFEILPSSFTLPPASINREATHFASGDYSNAYRATFNGRPIVIKVPNVDTRVHRERLHRLLIKEVVGWKWLRHENILPFLGLVSVSAPSPTSIASEWMENGNIIDFVAAHQDYNRIQLLVGAVSGLEYLHEHDIVHGDLKGVNIMIDSECRARLVDFGLAAVIDESTSMTTSAVAAINGAARWMAPELLFPGMFGFTGVLKKQLPSKDTDIYAIGMTILEVITGGVPFANYTPNETVRFKVLKGNRPNRPPSGFSDALWELLAETWVVQYAREPRGRPPTRAVLDRLKGCVGDLGKPIEGSEDSVGDPQESTGDSKEPTCYLGKPAQDLVEPIGGLKESESTRNSQEPGGGSQESISHSQEPTDHLEEPIGGTFLEAFIVNRCSLFIW